VLRVGEQHLVQQPRNGFPQARHVEGQSAVSAKISRLFHPKNIVPAVPTPTGSTTAFDRNSTKSGCRSRRVLSSGSTWASMKWTLTPSRDFASDMVIAKPLGWTNAEPSLVLLDNRRQCPSPPGPEAESSTSPSLIGPAITVRRENRSACLRMSGWRGNALQALLQTAWGADQREV